MRGLADVLIDICRIAWDTLGCCHARLPVPLKLVPYQQSSRIIRVHEQCTQELIWVAKEGLKAPLPKDWKPCKTPGGDIYYFNFRQGLPVWNE